MLDHEEIKRRLLRMQLQEDEQGRQEKEIKGRRVLWFLLFVMLAILALFILFLIATTMQVGAGPTTIPDLNYFRAEIDYQGKMVLHWAGSGFDPATGSFALTGAGHTPGPLPCTGIPYETDCDCRADTSDSPSPDEDTFWMGCYFDPSEWGFLRRPDRPTECLAGLLWMDNDGTLYAVSSNVAECPAYVYLPIVIVNH